MKALEYMCVLAAIALFVSLVIIAKVPSEEPVFAELPVNREVPSVVHPGDPFTWLFSTDAPRISESRRIASHSEATTPKLPSMQLAMSRFNQE